MADKKRNKALIITSVVAVMLVLALAAMFFLPELRLSLASGGQVRDGVLPSVSADEHITDVPEGEVRYLINKRIVFDSPYSQGAVMLENPSSCEYSLRFVIYNSEGKMIYTSPLIEPGQYLERDKLTAVVGRGEHNCSYSAEAYIDGKLEGEVTGVVTVVVK